MNKPIGEISLQMYKFKRGGYAACSFILSKSNENMRYVYMYDVDIKSGVLLVSDNRFAKMCASDEEVSNVIHKFIRSKAQYSLRNIKYEMPNYIKKDIGILLGLVNEHNYKHRFVITMMDHLAYSLTDDTYIEESLLLEIYRRLLYMKRNNNTLPREIEMDDDYGEYKKTILPYL